MTEVKETRQQILKTCLAENHYIIPSYQIYGGLSGFHDYGILGKKMKNKIISLWRDTFINDPTDTIVEIETPNIISYDVLKASGHVDRFTDLVVSVVDQKTNTVKTHRADHLAKKWFKENNMSDKVNEVDSLSEKELEDCINQYKMIDTKDDCRIIIKPMKTMFEIQSTSSNNTDFLRPELAQGIFVNYKSCKQFLQKEPPFGIAQTGSSFRKEISPQQFIRMREFTQQEIEYFFDPQNKCHHSFDKYKDTIVSLFSSQLQTEKRNIIQMTIEDAVKNKIISSNLMAYFIARIYLFVISVGLKYDKIRFRQHMQNEMAHYSVECWDLETFVNDDWLECIGIADRGCYDLKAHGMDLIAQRNITPVEVITQKIKPNMKLIVEKHGAQASKIKNILQDLQENKDEFKNMENTGKIFIDSNEYLIEKNMYTVTEEKKLKTDEKYCPHVLEPSIGTDRLIYSILEQNYFQRECDILKDPVVSGNRETKRNVLSLPQKLAPYEVAIFPLSKKDVFNETIKKIIEMLILDKISYFTDNSSTSIGKKYTRADEMGIKYAITIDFESLVNGCVTIRERDSMKQIRVKIEDIIKNIN